jgi:hypothetical protein
LSCASVGEKTLIRLIFLHFYIPADPKTSKSVLEIYPQFNKQFYIKKKVADGFLNPKSSFSVIL